MTSVRIGVVGDLHTHWDDVDVTQFSRSTYDSLLFTGDLGGGTAESSLRVAKIISRLTKHALVMPGNNDTGDIETLSAELVHRSGMKNLSAVRQGKIVSEGAHSASITLCGYSTHRFTRGPADFTLIAGRPHSLGGDELSFPEHMQANYCVDSIRASTERLCELVDETATENVLFFSHNGPAGLGEQPNDMWGCDFKAGGGDWGDPDLSAAIRYAVERGKRVLAVIAGHMHLRTKCGRERPWRLERDGILFVNAARVPRIFSMDSEVYRHHIELEVTSACVNVKELLLPESRGYSIDPRMPAARRSEIP